MIMELQRIFETVKNASNELALISDDKKNEMLCALADAIVENREELLEANRGDLEKMDKSNTLYDRLQLTEKRLDDIASDMRHVAELPSPLGRILMHKKLENGLDLKRISVPFGVIGIVYEARPNVSFDVFSICFKSGNAWILKGGKDADISNRAIIELVHKVLKQFKINEYYFIRYFQYSFNFFNRHLITFFRLHELIIIRYISSLSYFLLSSDFRNCGTSVLIQSSFSSILDFKSLLKLF